MLLILHLSTPRALKCLSLTNRFIHLGSFAAWLSFGFSQEEASIRDGRVRGERGWGISSSGSGYVLPRLRL